MSLYDKRTDDQTTDFSEQFWQWPLPHFNLTEYPPRTSNFVRQNFKKKFESCNN